MTGKTHLCYGIGTGVLVTALTAPSSVAVGVGMIGATMLGSLTPDIDSKTSKISQKMRITSTVVSKMFGHRGFIHSPFCLILIYLIGMTIFRANNITDGYYILSAFAVGYAGHLFLDFLTKGGIPLLYPFKTDKYHLTNMKTGGKAEIILFIFACIVTVGVIIVSVAYGEIMHEYVADIINRVFQIA